MLAKDGSVLIGSVGNSENGYCLQSVNASTGQPGWSYACGGQASGYPSLEYQGAVISARDGAIFFSNAGSLVALEPSGAKRWVSLLTGSVYEPGGILTAPALSADGFTVFVGCAGSQTNAAMLFAVDNGSGATLWSVRAPASVTGVAAGAAGGVVFSTANALRFLNESGAPVWATTLDGIRDGMNWPLVHSSSAPAVAPNGTVYVLTSRTFLVAFNASGAGENVSADDTASTSSVLPSNAPVITPGAVYFATPNGHLIAVAA